VIAFALQNASRQGDYYSGLAGKVEASCQSTDDLANPMGSAQEGSTRQALDFLAGRSCTAIAASTGQTSQALRSAGIRELLTADKPTPAQREVPGLY
jgi:carboxyl-terminal processing protease